MAQPLALPATLAANLAMRAAGASARAGANLGELLFRGSLADTRPSPHTVLVDEPHCQVRRHDPPAGTRRATPIVFVPPLGGTARVYDIRRGHSMAQSLAEAGHPVYVLDYGSVGFEDRDLGLAEFVDGYVARAVDAAHRDSGARVLLAGWCAGGIFAALYATSTAARSRLAGLALLASPLDLSRGHMLWPLANLRVTEAALRLARETGLPAPVVSWMFKLSSPVKQVTKPLTLLRNLDDREFLVHFASLDEYVNAFAAYPGAAGYELVRGLVDERVLHGTMRVGRRRADVRRITVPTLVIAGSTDVLAPAGTVQAWTEVLRDSEYHVVAGGHLGVMAGRRAPASTWALLEGFAQRIGNARPAAPRRRTTTPRRPARPVVLPSPRDEELTPAA